MSGSGATTVTYNDTANTIVVSSTDTNTTYGAGNGISLSGTTFSVSAGTGLTQTATGLAIDSTVVQTNDNVSFGTGSFSGLLTTEQITINRDGQTGSVINIDHVENSN